MEMTEWHEDRNMFEDNPIVYITGGRIPKEKRNPNLCWYSVRHSDCGFDPAEIEKAVWVNHMFDLATKKPLQFTPETNFFTEHEEEAIWMAEQTSNRLKHSDDAVIA